jgi:hypothetical protein
MYGETRQHQARRWAKFPASVLFALSVIWLLRSFFELGGDASGFQDLTHTGVGILQVVWDLLIIPVGGAVIGIYLLLRKRWAAPVAALLPLKPLVEITGRKLVDVQANFHDYNTQASMTKLYEGLVDLLIVAGFWALFVLMLFYLWKVWTLLRERPRWRAGAAVIGEQAGGAPLRAAQNGDGDVCFMMPETEDVETA